MSIFPCVAFLTGSVGSGEWIVLFVVVLIVVGPRRMPEIARKLGRMMEMFRRAADEFKDQLMTMDQDAPKASPGETLTPPPAAAGGVPSAAAGDGSSTAPYDDAHSNLATYPGNEAQAEKGASDALPEVSGAEKMPSAPEPVKPAEGGA